MSELNSTVIKEAKRWMLENKGTSIKEDTGFYCSPRISSEIVDCSMPMTFDHYNFCSLGCIYCFAYVFKSNNPSVKEQVGLQPVNWKKQIAAMEGKTKRGRGSLFYKHFYEKRFLLHWGGLADPFCNFESKNSVGLKLIRALGHNSYPTLFSFKGDTIFKAPYIKTFEHYAHQQNFAFQISIITNSDELSQKVEIGVPNTSRRLEAMKLLSDMGYYTILRLRPFIIGVSEEGLDELLDRSYRAGARGVSMEFFAMDSRANLGMRKRHEWLAQIIGVDNLEEYFRILSPSERGGYMRLNRLVKEAYVRQVYEFCIKHGMVFACSDPDFKELNTSGSCCAMPDNFEKNPELQNWTRSQLTYHVKEARKAYHKNGELRDFYFGEVYGNESYLDEVGFASDHVSTVGEPTAIVNIRTQRNILQDKWNNLRSPANPRNYLHGKVMPISTLDKEGNLVYRYNPSEYEGRWVKEAVDLTK